METLEKALNAEIKRRVELNRQIERRCQNQGKIVLEPKSYHTEFFIFQYFCT